MSLPNSLMDSSDSCAGFNVSGELRQDMSYSSLLEHELINNMTSFLEANAAEDVDKKVLRNMAVALAKQMNDTSPGTLHDVTMENPYGIGYRSPCVSLQPYQGSTSPAAQGRSVREFEEQMATLRKENFNLKLRLYFMEESIPGYSQASNSTEGQDTLMKQLIDSKVEMEILRKEIEEKRDVLKEAAAAMTQMENIQKDTEDKYEQMVEELRQKIQYMEMERDMEKSHTNSNLLNDLLGRSETPENLNALQKIHELQGLLKQSEEKLDNFQQQICSLEHILGQRDETIKEYEDKVKELVFQNAELLESFENKEKESSTNERTIRGLRSANANLKAENEKLVVAFKHTQDNFSKEMSNIKTYERQMREQEDALTKMQSTLSIKTAKTDRLLETIQDFEKMVTKMNIERNVVKRENQFFRTLINKLQTKTNKQEICQKYGNSETKEKPFDVNSKQFDSNYCDSNKTIDVCHQHHRKGGGGGKAYKLEQQICVRICNNQCLSESTQKITSSTDTSCDLNSTSVEDMHAIKPASENLGDYLNEYKSDFPIRYTISNNSDDSIFPQTNDNCCSLTPSKFSSSLLCYNNANADCCVESDIVRGGFLKAQKLEEELQKLKMDMADKLCLIQDLEEKLQNRDQKYDKSLVTIQKLMSSLKNQQTENSRLKNNTQASNVSSNEKEHAHPALSGLECTGLCRSFSDAEALNELTSIQKQNYDNIIEQQGKNVETLKAEVKKKTADLQNLINKEHWEKQRLTERLNKILNKSAGASPVSAPNTSQAKVTGELQESFSDLEYNKALQRNKILQCKVDTLVQRLGMETQNNDALVKQLQTELQQARLDAETAEKWRRQCADLCSTLSTRLEELAGFLNSLLKHKDVLCALAVDKRKAMRRAVDRSLDLSKSLNRTLSVSGTSMLNQSLAELHNLSDILGDVDLVLENKTFNSHEELQGIGQHHQSMETLRAENKALKKELDKRRSADSKKERRSLPLPIMAENRESESEAWSEPDRIVSLARIGLEDNSVSLMVKEQPSASQHNETDSDYSESKSRSFKARTQERIQHLEQLIQQRDNRILEIKCQLADADNCLKKENLKVLEVTQELEHLKQRNEELQNDLINIGSQQPSNMHNESMLLRQIDEKSRSLEKLQEERERLMVESKLAEMQINSMKADMEIVKQNYEEALQQAAEREKQQLSTLKKQMEDLYQKCLQKDYVAINVYEECQQKLLELQKQYLEAQRSIDCLQENEHELKQTLVETELASRNLQKQVDESTLRASKAAMERVKVLNDKLQLEKRVAELSTELSGHEQQREQMQKQISHLEIDNKTLTARLAIVQQSANKNEDTAFQSGYTSEEVPIASNMLAQRLVGEQRIQNASPDLGIESDAGRISSVESHNVQRPLSDDKEGLVDGMLNKKRDCCVKVEQENAELRRKLLRTKRAFEDTYEKLRNSNQRKAQIEKDIKNQILKTHNVLKNVRSNMENQH